MTQIDISQAENLLQEYSKDTLLHNQQVGNIMKYFASQLWEDEDYRYVVWILHDIDRDHIGKVAANHLQEEFANIINKLPYDQTIKDQIIHDIRTHYPHGTNIQPETLIQKYLISIDELSGLMYAYSRMRWWFEWMETKWVIKKIKDKAFAAWVDREHVRNCESYLKIPLEDFVSQMILAYQNFA